MKKIASRATAGIAALTLAVSMAAPASAAGRWTPWNPNWLDGCGNRIVSLTTQNNPGFQEHGYLGRNGATVYRASQWYTGWYSSNGNWSVTKIRYLDFSGQTVWGTFCSS